MMRFSSKGGLAVDYTVGGGLNKLLWKGEIVSSPRNFLQSLYVTYDDSLKELVDMATAAAYSKDRVFPAMPQFVNVPSTYANFVTSTDEIMVQDQNQNQNQYNEMNFSNSLTSFMSNSGFRQ